MLNVNSFVNIPQDFPPFGLLDGVLHSLTSLSCIL